MTIKECYEVIGSNYQEVSERIGSDKIFDKFVNKFPSDKSFEELKEGLQEKDGKKAFRAAHTLKGICLNLGFDKLYEVSSELTEKLRGGETAGSENLFTAVAEQYEIVTGAIAKLEGE